MAKSKAQIAKDEAAAQAERDRVTEAEAQAERDRVAEAAGQAEIDGARGGPLPVPSGTSPIPNVPAPPALVKGDGVPLPTSETRTFILRAETHPKKYKARLGGGPCTVLGCGPVMMPNGDLAREHDTFDPIAEGMAAAKYANLLGRKFISGDKDVEEKLVSKGK